jgi:hypothetical protein
MTRAAQASWITGSYYNYAPVDHMVCFHHFIYNQASLHIMSHTHTHTAFLLCAGVASIDSEKP